MKIKFPDLPKLKERESFSGKDMQDYAQQTVMQNLISQKEVKAWMVPTLLSFKSATSTSCPSELQAQIEGTVAWGVDIIGDAPSVTDKFGIVHKPYPLGRID